MKPISGVFLWLVLLVDMAHASTIGKVTGALSAKPIGGVKIWLVNKPDIEAVYSDSLGLFDIDAKAGEILQFEKEGFSTLQLAVVDSRVVFAHLSLEVEQQTAPLDTLLSTAGRSAKKVSQIPASVVLVTQKEIARHGYTDVADILRYVPGLYSIEEFDWTGTGSNFGVRGFLTSGMNNSMMLMINGVTQFEDYWGFYPLNRVNVPVESIERIEIVRGPMSVVYGAGALLGAINIITRQDKSFKGQHHNELTVTSATDHYRQVSARFRTEGGYNQTFIGSYQSGNHDYGEFARASSAIDNSDTQRNEGIDVSNEGVSDYSKLFVSINGDYANRLSFNANVSEVDHGIFVSYDQANHGGLNGRQFAHMLGYNFDLGYQSFWLDEALRTKYTGSYYSHFSQQDYSSGHDIYGFASYRSNAFQLEFDGFVDGRALWQLPFNGSFGLMYRNAFDLHTTFDIDVPFSRDRYLRMKPGDHMVQQSIFAQADIDLNEALLLTLGMRVELGNDYDLIYGYREKPQAHNLNDCEAPHENDQYSPYEYCGSYKNPGLIYTPRLALIYSLDQNNVFKLLYGKGDRQPSFGQTSDAIASGNRLDPEQVKALELIYLNQYQGESLRLNTQLSVFRNQLNDLIYRVSNGNYRSDTTSGTTTGFEFNSDWVYGELTGSMAFSYQRSRPDAPVSEVPMSPRWLANVKLAYPFKQHFALSALLRYQGKMYNDYQCSDQFNCVYLGAERAYSQGAWLMDIQLHIDRPRALPVELSMGVKNLFNSRYQYPISLNSQWADRGFSAPGRQFQLRLQYLF